MRVDMTTIAQGNRQSGPASMPSNADDGLGYNPPSLLGLATGTRLHGGNTRTLESLFEFNSGLFATHYRSLAPNTLMAEVCGTIATI